MNEKEIAELRRNLTQEKCNVSAVYGCYVSREHEIISTFRQSFGLMQQDENDKYLSIFKKTMSGTIGKNLTNISFSTDQVLNSEEHKMLTALKESALKDENLLQGFFRRIVDAVEMEDHYVILLTLNTYDVPYRAKDGARIDGDSEEVFTYLICSICPVKMSKTILSYDAADKDFRSRDMGWVVSAPETGFVFPAFDDRQTNIYGALYYDKNGSDAHKDFYDVIFHTEQPMPAEVQTETFREVLADALDTDCNLKVVQYMHQQICEKIEEYKSSPEEDPLVMSKEDVREVLQTCGIPEEKLEKFEKGYQEGFGENTELTPQNILNPRQFELRTPDVTIRVSPNRYDLVETRVIDGTQYILIKATDGVEVNGVSIHID